MYFARLVFSTLFTLLPLSSVLYNICCVSAVLIHRNITKHASLRILLKHSLEINILILAKNLLFHFYREIVCFPFWYFLPWMKKLSYSTIVRVNCLILNTIIVKYICVSVWACIMHHFSEHWGAAGRFQTCFIQGKTDPAVSDLPGLSGSTGQRAWLSQNDLVTFNTSAGNQGHCVDIARGAVRMFPGFAGIHVYTASWDRSFWGHRYKPVCHFEDIESKQFCHS